MFKVINPDNERRNILRGDKCTQRRRREIQSYNDLVSSISNYQCMLLLSARWVMIQLIDWM